MKIGSRIRNHRSGELQPCAITLDQSLRESKTYDDGSYNLIKLIETLKGVRHLSNKRERSRTKPES